ncbi:MAG TPA: hypothetical protein PKD74_00790 [Candidatus Dependentiae bacterium]|nr:hypothetical protein [Candidatus Dependentiae bacterium]
MAYCKTGFILIEALVSCMIITVCIVSFMRCQVHGLTLQAYALKVMSCIDRIEEILDNSSDLVNENISICNNHAKITVYSVSKPVLYAAPDRLVFNDVTRMKVAAISVSCTRDDHNEIYCMPTIIVGKRSE